jgi:hypothetical protein
VVLNYERYIERKTDEVMEGNARTHGWSDSKVAEIKDEIVAMVYNDCLSEREVITHNSLYSCRSYDEFIQDAIEVEGIDISYANARRLASRTKKKIVSEFERILYETFPEEADA